MANATVLDHPLASHHLAVLRDKDTPSAAFRSAAERLTYLVAMEATRDLALEPVSVETPLCTMEGHRIGNRLGVVPILRAGLGMVHPMLNLIPEAEIWHLGMYRDEATAQPVSYYNKLPEGGAVRVAFVVDPMLATGGSASAAIEELKSWGVEDIRMLGLIGAPEGVAHLNQAHADVPIFLAALDDHLNENKFIVPGLGDAGDRIFNTR